MERVEVCLLKVGPLYGGVAGLDDDELLDVSELDRMGRLACRSMGEPLALKLPWKPRGLRAGVDGDGGLDWGAFDTWDFFEQSDFDKRCWRVRELRRELDELRLRSEVVRPGLECSAAVKQVLDYVRRGVLCSRWIVDASLRGYAEMQQRMACLREELAEVGV